MIEDDDNAFEAKVVKVTKSSYEFEWENEDGETETAELSFGSKEDVLIVYRGMVLPYNKVCDLHEVIPNKADILESFTVCVLIPAKGGESECYAAIESIHGTKDKGIFSCKLVGKKKNVSTSSVFITEKLEEVPKKKKTKVSKKKKEKQVSSKTAAKSKKKKGNDSDSDEFELPEEEDEDESLPADSSETEDEVSTKKKKKSSKRKKNEAGEEQPSEEKPPKKSRRKHNEENETTRGGGGSKTSAQQAGVDKGRPKRGSASGGGNNNGGGSRNAPLGDSNTPTTNGGGGSNTSATGGGGSDSRQSARNSSSTTDNEDGDKVLLIELSSERKEEMAKLAKRQGLRIVDHQKEKHQVDVMKYQESNEYKEQVNDIKKLDNRIERLNKSKALLDDDMATAVSGIDKQIKKEQQKKDKIVEGWIFEDGVLKAKHTQSLRALLIKTKLGGHVAETPQGNAVVPVPQEVTEAWNGYIEQGHVAKIDG